MKKAFLCFLVVCLLPFSYVKADNKANVNLAEEATSAIMIEVSTGNIIFEKNSHNKQAPASMTKMMTMLLIAESVEKGIIGWDDQVTVSENASSMGGSQILLETGEKMSVKDMLKGIAVASGNDATVAMAEKIAGTEQGFVDMMNKRASELGLKDTHFKNPHGLDEANHYSSAYDMSMLAREVVKHEEILKYTSIYEDYLRQNTDRKFWLVNTNKLVRFYDGVDGLKTGYTVNAGHCLTATAKKNGMRIIAVVMGEKDSKVRNTEVTEMLDYAFAQYSLEHLLSTNSSLGKKEVEKGKKKYVELVPTEDVTILNRKIDGNKNATYDLTVDDLKAPLKRGDVVGTLTVKENEKVTRKIPVTVKEDVGKSNLLELYWQHLQDIVSGNIQF